VLTIPVEDLIRQCVSSAASPVPGKTVLGKILVEEAAIAGRAGHRHDLNGDLSSLLTISDA